MSPPFQISSTSSVPRVREHRVERRQIAVDIGEEGDAHDLYTSPTR